MKILAAFSVLALAWSWSQGVDNASTASNTGNSDGKVAVEFVEKEDAEQSCFYREVKSQLEPICDLKGSPFQLQVPKTQSIMLGDKWGPHSEEAWFVEFEWKDEKLLGYLPVDEWDLVEKRNKETEDEPEEDNEDDNSDNTTVDEKSGGQNAESEEIAQKAKTLQVDDSLWEGIRWKSDEWGLDVRESCTRFFKEGCGPSEMAAHADKKCPRAWAADEPQCVDACIQANNLCSK